MKLNAEKTLLRKKIRGIQVPCAGSRSLEISQTLYEALRNTTDVKRIGLYAAMGNEPDLRSLFERKNDWQLAYPRVSGETMEFFSVTSWDGLVRGSWGILEPPLEAEICADLDLVICPGAAFSLDGSRLGKGKGYYDRYLSQIRHRPTLWGIQFRELILDDVPCESHDVKMDRIFIA